jgi:ABC-type sugar transport system ATPase subunit
VFVGGFIGSPAMNFFTGTLKEDLFTFDGVSVRVPEGKMKVLRSQGYAGKEIIMGIRPEDIHDEPVFIEASKDSKIDAKIEVAEPDGRLNDALFASRHAAVHRQSRLKNRRPGRRYASSCAGHE